MEAESREETGTFSHVFQHDQVLCPRHLLRVMSEQLYFDHDQKRSNTCQVHFSLYLGFCFPCKSPSLDVFGTRDCSHSSHTLLLFVKTKTSPRFRPVMTCGTRPIHKHTCVVLLPPK
ncbi:unnamed protein product [Ectocarpus sp. 13 AM-2016]